MEMLYVLYNIMCHYHSYQQEALDKSIGPCTNDLDTCIYMHNSKGIDTAAKLY